MISQKRRLPDNSKETITHYTTGMFTLSNCHAHVTNIAFSRARLSSPYFYNAAHPLLALDMSHRTRG